MLSESRENNGKFLRKSEWALENLPKFWENVYIKTRILWVKFARREGKNNTVTKCYATFAPLGLYPWLIFLDFKIQRLFQKWCSFSPDEFVTSSIGIPTKCTYSVVHYLSNKQPWTFLCQINLKLSVVYTSKMEDWNVFETVRGQSLEIRNKTKMHIETVSTLTTEIHPKSYLSIIFFMILVVYIFGIVISCVNLWLYTFSLDFTRVHKTSVEM